MGEVRAVDDIACSIDAAGRSLQILIDLDAFAVMLDASRM